MNIRYSIIKIIANRVGPGGSILCFLALYKSIPSQHLQEVKYATTEMRKNSYPIP